ncbi:methionine--tRNA ligase [bacterium]|nr:methionine--tRNA ligase [bacterium]
MPQKFLVTSALPYVNGVKHMGNIIGSLLPADIYARWRRMQGHDVLAVCGTDEHGTPCELAALAEGMPVADYAAKYYEVQKNIYERLGLTFDFFGRTSSPQNHAITQHLFLRLWENGYITERRIKQLYCVDCARFLPDRYVEGTCPLCGHPHARGDQCEECTKLLDPTDLVEPRCAVCKGGSLEVRESAHLFLDLPKAAPLVEKWIATKSHWPRTTLSIAQKWLDEGLRERCITRDLEWGIPVPLEQYSDKVFYVWFDAPIGYIGISMEWAAAHGAPDAWQDYWKDPDCRLVQFMAKDNIPFHTVTWPSVMMAADDGFVSADFIKGFQWLNYEGGKFSTSQGRGIFSDQALELFPPDTWRYYLCVVAPEKGDSDFTWAGFQTTVNSDLANTLGNFVHRTLTFLNKNWDGVVPAVGEGAEPEATVRAALADAVREVDEAMEDCQYQKAVRAQRAAWAAANVYFDQKQPWKEVKVDKDAAAVTLATCVHLCRSFAVLGTPFIPFTGRQIFANLALDGSPEDLPWSAIEDWSTLTGHKVAEKPTPLFKKIEKERADELHAQFAGG